LDTLHLVSLVPPIDADAAAGPNCSSPLRTTSHNGSASASDDIIITTPISNAAVGPNCSSPLRATGTNGRALDLNTITPSLDADTCLKGSLRRRETYFYKCY